MTDRDSPRDLMWIAILLLAMTAAGIFVGEISSNQRHSELLVDSAKRDAAALAYQTQQADANARILQLEIRVSWLRKALWQGKFPDVDEETLITLKEIVDERAAEQ